MIAGQQDRPLGFSATLDLRVLAFTAAVSMLSGVVFGLAPALRSLRVDLTPALKEGAAASSGAQQGRHRWFNIGNVLVTVQAALAIVVLAGAGLMVHTVSNLKNLDPGFDTRNLLTFELNPQLVGYNDRDADALYRELQQQIAALPGVTSVAYSEAALLAHSWSRTDFKYIPPGESKPVNKEADWMPISPDFFSTLKIPLVAGRIFTAAEYEQSAANNVLERAIREAKPGAEKPPAPTVPEATIVNQTFVKKYFPGVNPLGQRFGADDGSDPDRPQKSPGYVIVGVVGDAKYESLRRDIDATMYVPLVGSQASFEVRTAGDPKTLIAPLRSLINQRDSNLPMVGVKTQSELIEALVGRERIIANLSSLFGILALSLACIGLYGLLSYEVTRRTREIGIRMALGARRGDLIQLVVSRGIALVLAGIAAGVVGALAAGRLLNTLLYGVKANDPVTLVGVTVLLLGVAACAAFVPARRASTVNPVVALRYE
jgi:predicted permease